MRVLLLSLFLITTLTAIADFAIKIDAQKVDFYKTPTLQNNQQ